MTKLLQFAYHRSIAPTLVMLLGLAIAETLVLHLVAVALRGWKVAIMLGLVDLSLVIALIGLLRAIRRNPVIIANGVLIMRVGRLKSLPIPLDQIAGFRESWDKAALKQKGVSNLALGSWPNIFLDLSAPLHIGRRRVSAAAHRLDDPGTFRAALTRLTSAA